jgi:hypothetical protein
MNDACMTETLQLKMMKNMDHMIFQQCCKSADGRMTYQEFKDFMNTQLTSFEGMMGDSFFKYSEADLQKRYNFLKDLAGGQNPHIGSYDKWINIWVQIKRDNMIGTDKFVKH